MNKVLDHYQFDLRDCDEPPTLNEFKQLMSDMAAQGWDFAGSVTLKMGQTPREVTVWRKREAMTRKHFGTIQGITDSSHEAKSVGRRERTDF